MQMFDCESTLIAQYGYDPKTREMRINFHKGGTYSYADVPQEAFEEFLRAPSKGKHFLAHIKGAYAYEKI